MKNEDCKSVTTDQCLRRQEEILEGRVKKSDKVIVSVKKDAISFTVKESLK